MSVASPCNKICLLDARGEYCVGCWRTLEEIGAWGGLTDDERRRIMAALPERGRRLASDGNREDHG